jgi:hypothetical protein
VGIGDSLTQKIRGYKQQIIKLKGLIKKAQDEALGIEDKGHRCDREIQAMK